MGILNATAILLTVLPFQDPASTKPQDPRPESFILNIHAYPQETIAVFGMNPVEPHSGQLYETSLYAMWQKLAVNGHSKALMDGLVAQAAQATGLTPEQFQKLAGQGVSAGITGWSGSEPNWMGLAELGDNTSDIQGALERARTAQKGAPVSRRWQDTQLWTIKIEGEQTLTYAVHGTTLVFGSSAQEVGPAISRLSEGREAAASLGSLISSANYKAFLTDIQRESKNQSLLAGYIDLGAILKQAIPMIPARQRGAVSRTLNALHVNEMYALGITTRISGGVVHDLVRLCMPNPERGVLGALLVAPKQTSTASAKITPNDISSFALTHVDFARLYEELLTVATVIDPAYPSMIREMVRGAKAANEFELEADLLQNLGNEIVTMQWQDEASGKQEFAVVLKMRDGTRLERALDRFRQLTGKAMGRFKAYQLSQITGRSQLPSMAVGAHHLVFATTQERLRSMTELIAKSETPGEPKNTDVEAMLRRTTSSTVATGWSDLSLIAVGYFDQLLDSSMGSSLPTSVDTAGLRSAFLELASQLGELRTSVDIDRAGISMRAHSTSGNLLGLATAFSGAAAQSMPDVLTGITTQEGIKQQGQRQDERFRSLLSGLGTAIQSYQEEHGGRYPTLSTLMASGAITPEMAGSPVDAETFLIGEYLLTILQPAETETPENFALVAWPAESKTGTVYLCLTDLQPKANQLIAGTQGMKRIQVEDLFLGGDHSGELTTGWSTIMSTQATITALDDKILPATIEAYNTVLAIENGDEGTRPADLIKLLGSAHPTVAARAAFALGKLKYEAGALALCSIAVDHVSLDVRQHAMAAIVKLRNPATLETSVTVLNSDNETLRSLAAQNLGRLQARAHSGPLLSALRSKPNADSEGEDKVQVVLALTDIGETAHLLTTAEALREPTKAQATALAFMFQTLSPKLDTEKEVTTLMGVLGHDSSMLRRYAITRLGQLKNPKSVSALEKQLASETNELRPLVEVALTAVRGNEFTAESSNLPPWLDQHWQKAQQSWYSFTDQQKAIVLGGSGGMLLLVIGTSLVMRRRRRRGEAEAWASMVNPSDEHEGDENYADGEYVEGEYAEGEYAEGEYAEGEFEEGDYVEGEFIEGEEADDEWIETESLDTIGAGDYDTEEPR